MPDAPVVSPVPAFPCIECATPLVWDQESLLACENPQCFAAGTPVEVWRAQDERVARGEDTAAPGAGWPRPRLPGWNDDAEPRPHAYVVPVSDGRAWWALLHGERLRTAQALFLCQVCGSALGDTAWVVVYDAKRKVLNDSALCAGCLTLARAVCPHLSDGRHQDVEVTRGDLLADDRPLVESLSSEPSDWRYTWTLRTGADTHVPATQIAPRTCHDKDTTMTTPRIDPADVRTACERNLATATMDAVDTYQRLVDQLIALRATIPQLGTPRDHDGSVPTANGYAVEMLSLIQAAHSGAGITRIVAAAGEFDSLVTPPSPDRP